MNHSQKPIHLSSLMYCGDVAATTTSWAVAAAPPGVLRLSIFEGQRFDYVISLCDRVREVCPQFPGSPAVVHWSMADPAAGAAPGEAGYPPFLRTADEQRTRIEFLLPAIDVVAAGPERK